MTRYERGICMLIASLPLVAMVGCEQEGPAENTAEQAKETTE